ncbi:MAG: NADH:ubiquinone oxidoreductase [Acidimicrobiaceae bacterium]|nr:NADH:ubiquinone oxidoreductase [Acidimicrobiaceae bacterium]
MPWVLKGISDGILTSKYPRKSDGYGETWRGSIKISPNNLGLDLSHVAKSCPTNAINIEQTHPQVDLGLCILCGNCIDLCGDIFSFQPDFESAKLDRDLLVVPETVEDRERLRAVRAALYLRVRTLRRSIAIRHVDCGSDGSEEWEISALTNPIYDVQRLGITFTASPRHADILLVTGSGSTGMIDSLKETYLQMPHPKAVIAVGTDAISGGMHRNSASTAKNGVDGLIPVDVYVPGSPPSPFGILYAILLAVGTISNRGKPC